MTQYRRALVAWRITLDVYPVLRAVLVHVVLKPHRLNFEHV